MLPHILQHHSQGVQQAIQVWSVLIRDFRIFLCFWSCFPLIGTVWLDWQPVTQELRGSERFVFSESADALKGKEACGE